ncbi:MAG TPA: hypothetical protein VF365_13085 [Candidatus Limnocylindria bacterium]
MRRLVILLATVLMLLAFAAPAAAAPPIKDSGSVQQASAFAGSCTEQGGNTLCTDVFIDAFSFEEEFSDVCVGIFTYTIRANGQFRSVSEVSGCGPANGFSVASDGSSAIVGPSEIQLASCDQRGCTDAGVVTVEASWTATSDPTPYSGKATFKEGTCTFRQSWTGIRAEAAASLSIGDESYAGDGFLAREEFTVSERCR